ncbi:hypothetical protein CDD81_1392 [Ophiocordyceps australis]|uniref:AA1-like domain-containing protein n=1 Tax=Ophiocordyceps australis TaxID=1399860 RepID=A0A2C5Y184_9HYPO|nr:hypothetical protein CDD81_1392 [Ophiocordyceps australis]
MRAFALGSLVALMTVPSAAQAPQREEIKISEFYVREDESEGDRVVHNVGFKLTGRDATDLSCSTTNPVFPRPTQAATCGNSKYRFSLHPGTDNSDFALMIYHEMGTGVSLWGQGNVPSICRAGGAGQDDYVCNQVGGPTTIVIDSTLPPVDH